MVAKKDDLMWKPCGPPLCSLFCTLELDYSRFFDPQIFIKVSALQLVWAIVLGTAGRERSGMRRGFCLWRVDSVSGETCSAQRESVSPQPKWERDLRGITRSVRSELRWRPGRLGGGCELRFDGRIGTKLSPWTGRGFHGVSFWALWFWLHALFGLHSSSSTFPPCPVRHLPRLHLHWAEMRAKSGGFRVWGT